MPDKIEVRGVRCLACQNLDLKTYPDHARLGYGQCLIMTMTVVFVRIEQSRNCTAFEPAPPDTVAAREMWAEKITIPAWQR